MIFNVFWCVLNVSFCLFMILCLAWLRLQLRLRYYYRSVEASPECCRKWGRVELLRRAQLRIILRVCPQHLNKALTKANKKTPGGWHKQQITFESFAIKLQMFRIFPYLDLTSLERFVIFYSIDSPHSGHRCTTLPPRARRTRLPKPSPKQSTHTGMGWQYAVPRSPTLTLIITNS